MRCSTKVFEKTSEKVALTQRCNFALERERDIASNRILLDYHTPCSKFADWAENTLHPCNGLADRTEKPLHPCNTPTKFSDNHSNPFG